MKMVFLDVFNIKKVQLALLLAVSLVAHVTCAKEIKIQNNADYAITLKLAHFATIAFFDRFPTISTISLEPGASTNLIDKPYDYTSDRYIPNTQWINAASEEERSDREEKVEKNSFLSPDKEDRYNAKITANGKESLYINIDDNQIGLIIQRMPEEPADTPGDGIYIWHDKETRRPMLRVIGSTGGAHLILGITKEYRQSKTVYPQL